MSNQETLLTKVLNELKSLTDTYVEKHAEEEEDDWGDIRDYVDALARGSTSSSFQSRQIPVDAVLEVLANIEEKKRVDSLFLKRITQTDLRGIELRLQAARTVQLQRLFDDYVQEGIIQLYERVRQVEEEEEFDYDFDAPMGGEEEFDADFDDPLIGRDVPLFGFGTKMTKPRVVPPGTHKRTRLFEKPRPEAATGELDFSEGELT